MRFGWEFSFPVHLDSGTCVFRVRGELYLLETRRFQHGDLNGKRDCANNYVLRNIHGQYHYEQRFIVQS